MTEIRLDFNMSRKHILSLACDIEQKIIDMENKSANYKRFRDMLMEALENDEI